MFSTLVFYLVLIITYPSLIIRKYAWGLSPWHFFSAVKASALSIKSLLGNYVLLYVLKVSFELGEINTLVCNIYAL